MSRKRKRWIGLAVAYTSGSFSFIYELIE